MKFFWLVLLAIEAAVVIAFYVLASSSDYFLRMPVRDTSVSSIVAMRAGWLAGVLAAFDVAIAAWIYGVRHLGKSEREVAFVSFAGAIVVFLFACWQLVLFIVFGFAQY